MARDIALWISRFLFAAGFIILRYCGAAWLNSSLRQTRGNNDLDRLLSNKPAPSLQTAPLADGALLGRVEIPKLHLSAVVFQETDSSVLNDGVGHLDGTALPGQNGNVVLAAHRDTFFRGLRNIKRGDLITVTTPAGVREYSVRLHRDCFAHQYQRRVSYSETYSYFDYVLSVLLCRPRAETLRCSRAPLAGRLSR